MTDHKLIAAEIDSIIRKNAWFDFHVLNYDFKNLIIAGCTDLTYSHTLEIIFENVFFVSGFFQGWHSDTKEPVFLVPENEVEQNMNERYEVQAGYQLFVFQAEDYKQNVIIAAERVSFNTDTVFYYDRPGLKENERIASFVKRNDETPKSPGSI
jgi:hypothetical protein